MFVKHLIIIYQWNNKLICTVIYCLQYQNNIAREEHENQLGDLDAK